MGLVSAGLLMYKFDDGKLMVFLVHPGGPFFTNKDNGWWGVPKGLIETNEDLLSAAKREFEEETGLVPDGENYYYLDTVKNRAGKTIHCWAFETKHMNIDKITCNTFTLEWPPNSGKLNEYPEVDEGKFFSVEEAQIKMGKSQWLFIERLQLVLEGLDKK